MRVSVLVLLLPAVFVQSNAPAQTLNDALARMDKSAPGFKSMTADIKRDVHTAIVNDDATDGGSMKIKREKNETKALMDFTGADQKTVSFDGNTVSVYYPKIKTIQIYNVGENRNLLDQFLLLGFGVTSAELKTGYEVSWQGSDMVNGKRADHIQLTPKSAGVQRRLKRADLWIPDNTGIPVQQQFFTSAAGDYMLITYSNIKSNASISDGELKLNLPKGVKVERPTL